MLDADPEFSVVGETADGLETVALVEKLQPNLLVVDVMMPGLNGLEVARQVLSRSSNTRIVVLSMHSDEAYVLEALKNGVLGYVLKDSSVDDLIRALNDVSCGMLYLSPPLSQRAIQSYTQRAQETVSGPYSQLTGREREVMQLTVDGLTNAKIAERLSISPRTAETHRANLMRKLNVRTQAELIRLAFRTGILQLETGPISS